MVLARDWWASFDHLAKDSGVATGGLSRPCLAIAR